ncbi:hypothetical protein [Enterococcus rotai]|uniref:hypothetical protein n=1 Tax=Enterococcus rotai TaxID=118060 RepID=UPI0035C6DECE
MDPKNLRISAEKMEKRVDFDELIVEGNNIHNAIKGLEVFVYGNICSSNVKLENVDILNGLIASILALSNGHNMNLDQYEKML